MTTTNGATLGTILRDLRRSRLPASGQGPTDRCLSMAMLARRAGVDHSHVSRIESGERRPSLGLVVALADAVGADGSERDRLFAAYVAESGEPPAVVALRAALLSLPPARADRLAADVAALVRAAEEPDPE